MLTYLTKQDVRAVALTLLAQETFDKGGATMDRHTGGGAPATGFLVGRKDMERVLTPQEVPDVYTLSVHIGHYIDARPSYVRFVGVWRDPSSHLVYLDSPFHFETVSAAVRAAEYNDQLAIWDCARSVSVPVYSTGRAA